MPHSPVCFNCQLPLYLHTLSQSSRICHVRGALYYPDHTVFGVAMTRFRDLLDEIGELAERTKEGIEVGVINKLVLDYLQVPMSRYYEQVVENVLRAEKFEKAEELDSVGGD